MTKKITIYHSPDADDAFMFYGLVKGGIGLPGYEFCHELCDIESLNQMALAGKVDVTAISVHAFPYLDNRYAILSCGASMGEKDYGPRIVATEKINLKDGRRRKIAIPGKYTSAALALQLYLKMEKIDADLVIMNFDKVQDAVKSREVDCGVIIHEGQITHEREGFQMALDLGAWWWSRHQLPLPLGVNIVNKSMGMDAMNAVKTVLKGSIECALANRKEALDYALSYGRGLSAEDADVFVGMYVNRRTLDLGPEGRESIGLFLREGIEAGIIPAPAGSGSQIEFI